MQTKAHDIGSYMAPATAVQRSRWCGVLSWCTGVHHLRSASRFVVQGEGDASVVVHVQVFSLVLVHSQMTAQA